MMELHTTRAGHLHRAEHRARKGPHAGDRAGHDPASRHLHYGRIILDAGDAPMRDRDRRPETGFICLNGSATATVDGASYTLGRYDALYMPRDSAVTITPGADGCDLAEIAAPVTKRHPVQFVRFADVQANPGLHFKPAAPSSKRDLNVLIGKNVEAGRIMAGVTFSEPGNWTSWPPHEHAAMLEEAYLYIDMPAPAFGIQLVYTNPREPELATIVREGDVVMMPQGYHPNVAAPGGSINFLWMMAAVREDDDRQYGVVNVQPDFGNLGSGLDKGEEMTPPNALAAVSTSPTGRRFRSSRSPRASHRQMVVGDRVMVCRLTLAAAHRDADPHAPARADHAGRARPRRFLRRRAAPHRDGRRRAAVSRRTSSTARRCSTRKWC